MKKSLHKHTKKELVNVVQDYQEMVNEVEEILNALLTFDHPLHTTTGLLDIRAAINRHVHKTPCLPGCIKLKECCAPDHQCA